MVDTGKAIIKSIGKDEENIVTINIYFDGELSDTDMKNIYHAIIKGYRTPVNLLCIRNKSNLYSTEAADYIKANAKHIFNKIACIADDPVTIAAFNISKETIFKNNTSQLFKDEKDGYHWLLEQE